VQNSGTLRGPSPSLFFFALPAVDQAESRGVEADRARFVAFPVVDTNRATFAVEIARIERQGLRQSIL